MRRAYKPKKIDAGPVTEMVIVNTFTKLIFGDEVYTTFELSIIDAFRSMEDTVSRDSHMEMGEFLRNLGVREMIQLVSRLRRQLSDGAKIAPATAVSPKHSQPVGGMPAHGRETL